MKQRWLPMRVDLKFWSRFLPIWKLLWRLNQLSLQIPFWRIFLSLSLCCWMFSLPKYELCFANLFDRYCLYFYFLYLFSLRNNSNARCLQTNLSDFKNVGAFQMHGECLIKQLDLLCVHNKTNSIHWKNHNDTHNAHAHTAKFESK